MRFVQVIYNNDTDYIKEIILKYQKSELVEFFNIEYAKEKKKAIPIMTRMGTKNVPLIVFLDENLEDTSAIWSENNPDWDKEIIKNLSENNE